MRIGMPIGRPHAPLGVDQSAGGVSPDPIDPITGDPIEIAELPESRRYAIDREGKARMTKIFMLKNTNDPVIARLFGPSPGEVAAGGLIAQTKEYTVVVASSSGAKPILNLTVDYAEDEENGSGRARETDDFSVEQETVTVRQVKVSTGTGENTQAHFPAATLASKTGTAIGINRFSPGGEIEGAPITLPIRTLTSVRFRNTITTAEMRSIDQFAPSINDGTWLGFRRGEVLFLGGNPVYDRTIRQWRWTYTFKIRADRSAGNIISVFLLADDAASADVVEIPKRGWDYLWYEVNRKQNTSGPTYAHVAKVYDEKPFNSLFSTAAEPDKWITS